MEKTFKQGDIITIELSNGNFRKYMVIINSFYNISLEETENKMDLKLITSGQNFTVFVSNGDREGHTPDENNEILLENLPDGFTLEIDPNSTDKIVGIIHIVN